MKILTACILFSACAAQAAGSCGSSPGFGIFSSSGITYSTAELEGRVAAVEQINLERVTVRGPRSKVGLPAVVSGGTVDVQSGIISGGIECGSSARLVKTSIQGSVNDNHPSARTQELTRIQKWIEGESTQLSKLPQARPPEMVDKTTMVFKESQGGVAVYTVFGDALAGISDLQFEGTPDSLFVLNVLGAGVILRGPAIKLSDGMNPGQILLNFPQAKLVQVTDEQGESLPASILAPVSAVHLWGGKIAGSVLAGSLMGNSEVDAISPDWKKLCSIL